MSDRIRRLFGPEALLIAIFILLSSGLYLGSRHFSGLIESNGSVVQVAGRMRLELNSLYRWLAEAESLDPAQRETALTRVEDVTGQIDNLLMTLSSGGQVEIAPGQRLTVDIDAIPEEAIPVITQIAGVWHPVRSGIGSMLADGGEQRDERLPVVTAQARELEGALIGQSSRLLGVISLNSVANAQRLQMVQVTGAVLGIAFFFLLIALYSRQLRAFRAAKRETDEILETVTSGLFLLDRDLRMGEQYSAELEYILQRKELAGTDFMAMLSQMVPSETLHTVHDYLELLFSERVEESLIGSLNPLDRVAVRLPTESGRIEDRYLEFSFRRVFDDTRLLHLLVAVNDVTDRVRLSEEVDNLKSNQDQHTERMLELLVSLLKLDPSVLDQTLDRWQGLMHSANEALKESNQRKSGLRPLIDDVFRPMHTLKSEAAGLGLEFLAQRALAVEQAMAQLRSIEELSGNDFLPATVRLEELFSQFSVVRGIIKRLRTQGIAGQQPADQPIAAAPYELIPMTQQLLRTLNRERGISAELRFQGLEEDLLPENVRDGLRDILVQLIRNACAHGIEKPAERLSLDKPASATLSIRLKPQAEQKGWELIFRDDGRGIDFQAIARRAVAMRLVSADDADRLSQAQLLKLMFHPGLSTASELTDDAGQGVGMDIVRAAADRLGARIRVGTAAGSHTTFMFAIPAQA